MPVSGDKITAPSYNTIRNTFIDHLTIGSGNIGYGQTANSSAVSAGQKVTQTAWANLALDIRRMADHQGTTVTLPTITAGGKVSANAANQLQTAATTVISDTNRFNVAAGQFSDEALTSSSRSTDWNTTIQHIFTCTFASANAARYFFNAGSTIRITPSFAKSASTSINDDWDTLINTLGTVVFGHTSTAATGASPGTGSGFGFHDLTTGLQQIYRKTGSAYAVNDYVIFASIDATSRIITFQCQFRDNKLANPNFDENVTGTVTNTVRMYRASGSNVAVTGPTASTTTNL